MQLNDTCQADTALFDPIQECAVKTCLLECYGILWTSTLFDTSAQLRWPESVHLQFWCAVNV